MKIGVFQFAGSGDIKANCRAIVRGMQFAADAGVRLLVFDENGSIVKEAPLKEECLMVYEFEKPELGYGAKGRVQISAELCGI